jgi:hypothetical protein
MATHSASRGVLLVATRDIALQRDGTASVRLGDALVLLSRAFGTPGRSASDIARLHVECSLHHGATVSAWINEDDVEAVQTHCDERSTALRMGDRVLLRYDQTEAFERGDFAATLVSCRAGRVVVRFDDGGEAEMLPRDLARKARIGGAVEDENVPPSPSPPPHSPPRESKDLRGMRSYRERGLWHYAAAFPWVKELALRAEPFVLAERVGAVGSNETFVVDERRTSVQRAKSSGKRRSQPQREVFLRLRDGRGWLLQRSADRGTLLLAEVAPPASHSASSLPLPRPGHGERAEESPPAAPGTPTRFASLLAKLIDETQRRNPLAAPPPMSPPPSPPPLSPPTSPSSTMASPRGSGEEVAVYTAACVWERPIRARARPDMLGGAAADDDDEEGGGTAFWLRPGEFIETNRSLVRYLNGHRVLFLHLVERDAWIFDCDPFDGRRLLTRANNIDEALLPIPSLTRSAYFRDTAVADGTPKLRFDRTESLARTRATHDETDKLRRTLTGTTTSTRSFERRRRDDDIYIVDNETSIDDALEESLLLEEAPWESVVRHLVVDAEREEHAREQRSIWVPACTWPGPVPITSLPEWPGIPVGIVEVHEAIVVAEVVEATCNTIAVRWLRLASGAGWCCDRSLTQNGKTIFEKRTELVAGRAAELCGGDFGSSEEAARKLLAREWLPWQLFSLDDVVRWGAEMAHSARGRAAAEHVEALSIGEIGKLDPLSAVELFAKVRQRHPDAYAWRSAANLPEPTPREALRSLLELRLRSFEEGG